MPNSNGNQDCAEMNALTSGQQDYFCSAKLCTVIRVKESPKFQLRGVCETSDVDYFYTFLVQSSNATYLKTELLGFKQTIMTYSTEQERWNIKNLVNGEVLAYTNSSSSYFPFGSHRWFFSAGSCTEPGQPWKELNLQQKVEQPGEFCCEDGRCID